jgi:hypothetical protein
MSDNQRSSDNELRSKLDLFRAEADDPEFASLCDELTQSSQGRPLLENHQRFERAMHVAMHDIPVPQDLLARVIAVVEAQNASPVGNSNTLAVGERPLSRRTWLMASAAATVAVAASLAIVLWPREHILDEADLQEGHAWHAAVADQSWRPMANSDLNEHQLPRQLRYTPTRYRDASQAVGRDATAYDLTSPSGTKATLFVIEQEEPLDIPYAAPQRPQHSTWGYSIAYWQDSSHIYVVVVESDHPNDYRRLIDSSADAGII